MRQLRIFTLISVFTITAITAANCYASAVVSPALLNQAGLEIVWQNSLAMEKNEKVQNIWLENDRIFVLTDINYIFCLDRNTGKLIVSTPVAKPGLPVLKPVLLNGTAYIVAGNTMVTVDVASGVVLTRENINFVVTAAPAVNNTYFYTPSIDKKLNAISLENKRTVFKVSADDGSAITSVVADDRSVIFSTNGGSVVAMDTQKPKKLWQFDAVLAITADIVKRNHQIYVAGRDTNVYKIDAANGKKMWNFYAGSALESSPRVTDDVVYQFAVGKGLYAIATKNGKQLWRLPEGIDLLAESGNRAYIIDKTGTCSVMDNKTGKKIESINFLNVAKSVANTNDNKIYIMDSKNNLTCIKPVGNL